MHKYTMTSDSQKATYSQADRLDFLKSTYRRSKTTPSSVQTGYSNGWRDKLERFRENSHATMRQISIDNLQLHCICLFLHLHNQRYRHHVSFINVKQQSPKFVIVNVLIPALYLLRIEKQISYLQWSNGSRLKFACGISEKKRKKSGKKKLPAIASP